MTVNNRGVVYHLVAKSKHNRHCRIDVEYLIVLIIDFADENLPPGLPNLLNSLLLFLAYFYLY